MTDSRSSVGNTKVVRNSCNGCPTGLFRRAIGPVASRIFDFWQQININMILLKHGFTRQLDCVNITVYRYSGLIPCSQTNPQKVARPRQKRLRVYGRDVGFRYPIPLAPSCYPKLISSRRLWDRAVQRLSTSLSIDSLSRSSLYEDPQ